MSSADSGQVPASASRPRAVVYAGVSVLNLVLVWWFDHPPTLDGPLHVYITSVLLAFGSGGAEALRGYFDLNLGANPNLLIYGPFYGLGSLFGLATAEKLVMSGFVVGLPLAVFYAARGCGRDPWLCLWLAVPLAFCMPLQLGFYNFSYGILVMTLALGAYFRADSAPSLGRYAGLAILGFLTLATHIFAALCLFFAVGLAAAWRAGIAFRGEGKAAALRSRLVPPFSALLPAALLALLFVLTNEGSGSPLSDTSGVLYRLILLFFSGFLWTFSFYDLGFGMALLIVIGVALYHVFRCRKEFQAMPSDRAMLLVFLGFVALFFAIPDKAGGGGWLPHRLQPYLYLALLLWLGGLGMRGAFRRGLCWVLVLFAVALALYRFPQYQEIDSYRQAYFRSLEPVAPGTTLAFAEVGPLVATDGGPAPHWRADPMPHLAAYVAAERGAVLIGLYRTHPAKTTVGSD